MRLISREPWQITFALILVVFGFAHSAQAQYVGATFGFNYSNDMIGPDTGTENTPLYNPLSSDPNANVKFIMLPMASRPCD